MNGSPPHTTEVQAFTVEALEQTGTLYLPEGDGWYPALVLVTSAGATGLEPYIAAGLGQGYAVLTFEAAEGALAATALAAADSLLMRPDIRPELIGLLGLGAGAWAAALAAARAPETAFAVLLPGDSTPPPAVLERLAGLDCPVLIFVAGEAAAASLREPLAHNPEAAVSQPPPNEHALLAALSAWLERQLS